MQNALLVHQCLNQLLAQLSNTNSYSLSLLSEIHSLVKAKLRLLTTLRTILVALEKKILFYFI